jgi:spermidine/putrescine transport system ATP-binding protein
LFILYSRGDKISVNGSTVKLENISKFFGDFNVIKNVSFDIKKGEFFSLLGPSGCGKTTLLRIIAGFEDPTEGAVYLDGVNVIPTPPHKRHVNTVFQNYALFPHLTVFENVAFPLRLKKLSESQIRKEVSEYLELVRLPSEMSKYPAQLSGGQKQRVSIARALINKPKVLLLDEPLSALDAKLRQHMLIELDAIHDKVGITFIYVTHDQQEALSVSDRVAVMNHGSVLQIGSPVEIYEAPADSFVARFIGETNYLRGKVISLTDNKSAIAEMDVIGKINIYLDKAVKKGDSVLLTVRPEKIHITSEKPSHLSEGFNVFEGFVDEIIYSGFQSKFFIKTADSFTFKVFKQHVKFFTDERSINWKDKVFLWWNPKDGFIVEVESA